MKLTLGGVCKGGLILLSMEFELSVKRSEGGGGGINHENEVPVGPNTVGVGV